jgi:NAD(P)-dependent dehydrogenase (short-subunit alcohol dehydrogenase family)
VHIVTGGYSGCGFELAKILYQHGATVYLAGRSQEKGSKAISAIKEAYPDSKGRVEFLSVDLSDLATIKPAAEAFLAKESKLHVLTNNAGVMFPPTGSKDKHGHELQLGTNCLGPFLFTKLLTPVLQRTAAAEPAGTVRVTWASSLMAQVQSPKHGVELTESGPKTFNSQVDYSQSKAGNCLLASEYAAQHAKDGIISVSWNPGNLTSDLQRHMSSTMRWIGNTFMLHPVVFGGYTELYAACSPGVTASQSGSYIAPWGRVLAQRADIEAAAKSEEDGGSGTAAKFWEYCDKETAQYA